MTVDKSENIEETENIGCVYTFLNSFKSYIAKFKPDDIYVVWDKKLTWPSTNFRKKLLEGTYKATRDRTESRNIHSYETIIVPILESLGVKNFYPNILEADDVISWLCNKIDGEVVVVSLDQDFLQLVSNRIKFYSPSKKELITLENFESIVNVKPESYLYYKVIFGDAADNITGFPGHGKVRAKKLAEQISQNKEAINNLSVEYKHLFDRNYKLICLKDSWLNEVDEEKCYIDQFDKLKEFKADFDKLKAYCQQYNFNSILFKIDEWESLFLHKPSSLLQILGADYAANL